MQPCAQIDEIPSHKFGGETTPMLVAERTSNGCFIDREIFWRRPWDKFLYVACLPLLAYAAGLATAHFHLPPYGALTEIWLQVKTGRRTGA